VSPHQNVNDYVRDVDLRLILDSIPGFVATSTPTGETEFVNRQLLEYLGKTLEEATGWGTMEAIHPDDLERISKSIAAWRDVSDTSSGVHLDLRLRGGDGIYRWFEMRATQERNAEGAASRWYYLLTDIDDQRRVEQTLRRSEAFLLEAQRLSHSGSWGHVISTGRVTTSPELVRVFDVQPGEDISDPAFWFGRIHPEDRARVQATFERCERERIEYHAEYRIVLPDGSIRYQRSVGHPVLSERGELVEFVGTAMDTTEQSLARVELERANTALRESERELSLIVETMPGLVWCASPEGELTYMNQRILEYLGASLDSLRRGHWISFVHPDDRGAVVEAWTRAVAGSDTHEMQNRLRRADGAYRWVQIMSRLGRDRDGRPTRWYGLLIDIHDQKKAEEALRRTERRLVRAAQVATVGELAAAVAHEVNQPLAAVVTNGQACLSWLSADPVNVGMAREAAERIVRDAKDAGEVVRRIRALFHRAAFEKASLDLNEVVREVVNLLRREIDSRRVAVTCELLDGVPPVLGDRVQLQQLFLNLLINGLEALDPVTDRSREIRVSTRRDGDRAIVDIRDNGIGIGDPHQVFEAFFTTKTAGMGMGLAICRSIAHAHGGEITAVPHEIGTSFTCTLPLQ
jgi:PAS domain S-box-containing protein